jgi:hypothetical protein
MCDETRFGGGVNVRRFATPEQYDPSCTGLYRLECKVCQDQIATGWWVEVDTDPMWSAEYPICEVCFAKNFPMLYQLVEDGGDPACLKK